jgi:hypothetical protein
LSGGEGWHNNHHAHPVSARHGLAWYEIDPNFWGIWLLAKLGLARKIQVAKFDRANPKPAGSYIRSYLLSLDRIHSTAKVGKATISTSRKAGKPT